MDMTLNSLQHYYGMLETKREPYGKGMQLAITLFYLLFTRLSLSPSLFIPSLVSPTSDSPSLSL